MLYIIILCPIFLTTKYLLPFSNRFCCVIYCPSMPSCLSSPFHPEAHPYAKGHGFRFCFFFKTNQQAAQLLLFSSTPVRKHGQSCAPHGSVCRRGSSALRLSCVTGPCHGSWRRKHQPGLRHREAGWRGTVASAELPLLPPSSYFR